MTVIIIPWLCLWSLSSEELKALFLPISSLSPTSQGSGPIMPVSQVCAWCDSLCGSGARLLVPHLPPPPPGLGGALVRLSSLSSEPGAPHFLGD